MLDKPDRVFEAGVHRARVYEATETQLLDVPQPLECRRVDQANKDTRQLELAVDRVFKQLRTEKEGCSHMNDSFIR